MKSALFQLTLASATTVLGISAFVNPVQAATFSGSDPGATMVGGNSLAAANGFDAAASLLGALQILDFETFPSPGVTVSSTDPSDGVRTNPGIDAIAGGNTTVGGDQYWAAISSATTTFSFATPIQAFGAYVTGLGTAIGQVLLQYNDGTLQSVNLSALIGSPSGGVGFFGFTASGKSISSVLFTSATGSGGDRYGIDDVRYVSASAEPIPTPALLPGLVGMGVAALRKKREDQAAE
jgi:hypothetical protein